VGHTSDVFYHYSKMLLFCFITHLEQCVPISTVAQRLRAGVGRISSYLRAGTAVEEPESNQIPDLQVNVRPAHCGGCPCKLARIMERENRKSQVGVGP
jgi:hypothetical protein